MKPFIIINPKGNVELFVPFSHLYNEQDGSTSTACFADKLNTIGYKCIRYTNPLLFCGINAYNEYRVFEIEMNFDSDTLDQDSRLQGLLDDVHKFTLGYPEHRIVSFKKRNP